MKKRIVFLLSVTIFFLFPASFVFLKIRSDNSTQIQSSGVESVSTNNSTLEEAPLNKFIHSSSNFSLSIKTNGNGVSIGNEKIHGVIVPHHLVAAPLIIDTLEHIAAHFGHQKNTIRQIVLLAPNHFLTGESEIITSNGDWQTQYGLLEGDRELIKKLELNNFTKVDNQAIDKEHGVFGLLPFIKYFFPETRIIPLMLRECWDNPEKFQKIAEFLNNNLSQNSLVIISADFSHYLPKAVADFHDLASVTALQNFDYDFLRKMDVDNPTALVILMKYLELRNARQFVLSGKGNSQDFSGEERSEKTTSYISGYFTEGEQELGKEITLLAFGDLMLDRNVLAKAKKNSDFNYPFLKMDLFFKGVDYRLANLEGPVTKFNSKALGDNRMQFTISPNFLKPLKQHFEIFNLANNHTLDFGNDGLNQTCKFLANDGFEFFGDPKNKKENLSIIIEKNGLKIGLVGFNGVWGAGPTAIVSEIKQLKMKTDFVIVSPHWGEEYQRQPSAKQKKEARAFIDAGADLILGSHPHVVQPIEIYKNRVIFYSLGNFVFDQYFSKETMEGFAIGVHLQKEYNNVKPSFYLFPYSINQTSQPELVDPDTSQTMLEWLSSHSQVNGDEHKRAIKQGLIMIK